MRKLTRRSFVTGIGAAGIAPGAAVLGATPPPSSTPPAVGGDGATYLFFSASEALFIETACARLIPADNLGPSAVEAGVPDYLDKQLGGAWGAGERLYRSGPWLPGLPTQGYQLPFTPAELFHTCLAAIDAKLRAKNTPFAEMPLEAQDAYLISLEASEHDLDGVPSGVFFDILWKMTVEGYFSDPVYGGNRDMAAWRMIGFPGAYADYFEAVDRHGVKFEREPMSLAQDAHGHVDLQPNIPAHL